MSMKSQNRLSIFALLIVGITALTIFGLNYLVDKISLKQPVTLATRTSQPLNRKPALDDNFDRAKPMSPKSNRGRPEEKFLDMGRPPKGMPPRPPMPDVRRLHGKDDALNIQRNRPPSEPPMPPRQERPYEGGPPELERDDERRRFYDNDPRNNFPPPYPYDYPPPDFDPRDYNPEEYEDYYDPYYNSDGYEGSLDLKEEELDHEEDMQAADLEEEYIGVRDKTADLQNDYDYEPYSDEEDFEDYIDEYLDEDY